jgi:predicted nucleic acid-binding OB-fold protein
MTIQKTIENPASRRITIDVPGEIPVGPIILSFAPAPAAAPTPIPEKTEEQDKWDAAARALGYQDDADYLRANSPKTIEEAIAEAEKKFNDPEHKNFFEKFYGALEGEAAYGDGMEYQRKMRDEWPD